MAADITQKGPRPEAGAEGPRIALARDLCMDIATYLECKAAGLPGGAGHAAHLLDRLNDELRARLMSFDGEPHA